MKTKKEPKRESVAVATVAVTAKAPEPIPDVTAVRTMKGTPLTEAAYEYIVQHFATGERALLEKMSVRAVAAGMPMINISDDQARFIAFFLKAMKAKRALDVGTLFGYSAAIMAACTRKAMAANTTPAAITSRKTSSDIPATPL